MEELVVGFDYTIWANRQWVETVAKFPDPTRANEVLRHMAFWQREWLRRATQHIEGKTIDMLDDIPPGEALEQGARDWQNFLYRHSDQDFKYQSLENEENSLPLHLIAKQLIFHSTYHRGQLRALAEEIGVDFPDTDFIFFSWDQSRWK